MNSRSKIFAFVKWFTTNIANLSLFLAYSVHLCLSHVSVSKSLSNCSLTVNCNVSYIKIPQTKYSLRFPTWVAKWFTIGTNHKLFIWFCFTENKLPKRFFSKLCFFNFFLFEFNVLLIKSQKWNLHICQMVHS